MVDEKLFQPFFEKMQKAIDSHHDMYGDTWKTEDVGFLEQRLVHKMNEYSLVRNPNKLISLANLAMLLNLRLSVLYQSKDNKKLSEFITPVEQPSEDKQPPEDEQHD